MRRAGDADRDALRRIHAAAFAREPRSVPAEVVLLDALIDGGDAIPALSLVAVEDRAAIGHVLCSTATVGPTPVAALGPIGVLPDRQRAGVGLALMHAVLGAADALDVPLVGLLGSTLYYRRFGFRPATALGIEPPDRRWGDEFQVRTLSAYRAEIAGAFRYAPAFAAVS